MTSHPRIRLFAFAVTIALVLTLSAVAQNTGTVRGVVTDPQDSVVPDATVTITNMATGAVRTTKTSPSGAYSFEQLPPGDYTLDIEAKGFKKAAFTNVRANVAKATDQNAKLVIGTATETVTVTAEGAQALVNTQDASLGNNFVALQITQLPLEARNVAALLTLQPGVTRQGYVAGARSDQSNVTLDGVDINESQTNAMSGSGSANTATAEQGPVLRLNSEAVEEFRVTTTTATATGSRSSAAQINLVTKSGTNAFHGAVFESHRNTIFTANDFFNNHSTPIVPRPALIRNTFGGGVGGPIIKDKFFFFYSYEGRRDASATSVVRTVPLASLGQGTVRYTNPSGGVTTLTTAQLTSIFPAVGINQAAVAALAAAAAKYPANDFTVGDSTASGLRNVAGFRFNAPTPIHLNSHQARLDYNLTHSQTLFLRANAIHDHLLKAPQFPDTQAPGEWDHPWGLAAGHTWVLNNNMVNNFRYGLTRQAFSQIGDSQANNISFRFVFSPLAFSRTLSRTNPVHNFVDDFSWVKGSHTIQFGLNSTIIRNGRSSFTNAFDNAITNPSFYVTGAIRTPVNNFSPIGSGAASATENAITALIGRYSQYAANFTFGHDGTLLASGTPADRNFANYGIEGYAQDSWKIKPNLTFTYGLRYSLWKPVTETNGFETKPNIPLGTYFERRLAGAAAGTPYIDPITVLLSGDANNASPLYHWDKTNFQPRVAIAYSPGILTSIFGHNHESVIRGGFSMTGDYFGQALAAFFDTRNTLGFGSNTTISANTYNVTTRPAPLFTGYNQAIRPLPGITVPGQLTFPQLKSSVTFPTRIESSLDENLVTPKSYAWSATFERQLPAGMLFQASYLGRMGRDLLLQRDSMALNNLVDPKSKMDWYTAAGQLEILRHAQTPVGQVQPIPYFENIFSDRAFLNNWIGFGYPASFSATQMVYQDAIDEGGDWTTAQLDLDGGAPTLSKHLFYGPQYGALTAFSSVGNSNYHAMTVSLRERFKSDVVVDFNYTWSHSLDDASGLQSDGAYGSSFLLNPIRQRDNYASSDFDTRHLININSVVQIPVGRGKAFLSNAHPVVNAILGGWQLSNIFRWNTGLPIFSPYDDARWATNWNVQSSSVRTNVATDVVCPTRGATPKLFGCNTTAVFQSLRNARPGETGDRNIYRRPGYVALDAGLGKSFKMPYSEHHELQIRWEVFNVSNTQRMGTVDTSRTGFGIPLDPNLTTPPTGWSNFTGIQGNPRVMQVTGRYSF